MSQVGYRAQRNPTGEKLCNARHGHGHIRGKNAVEKAAETKVRQDGKKQVRNWKKEY